MMLAPGFRPHPHAIGVCQLRPAAIVTIRHAIGDGPPYVS